MLIGQLKPLEPSTFGRSAHPRNRRINARSCIFNLAIGSKLRGCDLVKLRSDDICWGIEVRDRATIFQEKTRARGVVRNLGAIKDVC